MLCCWWMSRWPPSGGPVVSPTSPPDLFLSCTGTFDCPRKARKRLPAHLPKMMVHEEERLVVVLGGASFASRVRWVPDDIGQVTICTRRICLMALLFNILQGFGFWSQRQEGGHSPPDHWGIPSMLRYLVMWNP